MPSPSASTGTQKHAGPPSGNAQNANSGSFKKGDGGGSSFADVLRSMPVNADAERAALSCMLKAPNEVIGLAVEQLNSECFYIPAHRILYQTLLDIYQNRPGGNLDLITLNAVLQDRGLMDQVGGPASVADLLDDVPSPKFFEHYAQLLKEKFILRRIIQDCGECANRAYDSPEEVTGLLDDVETRILKIREAAEKEGDILPIQKHALKAVHTIEESFKNQGKGVTGLSSGFANLDKITGGLQGASGAHSRALQLVAVVFSVSE